MGGCSSAQVASNYVMEISDKATHFEVDLGSVQLTRSSTDATIKLSQKGSNSNLGKPERRGSSSGFQVPSEKATNPNLSRRGTSGSLSISSMSPPSSGISVKVSSAYPWLLKSANISNAFVESIEDVRILGRGLMGTVRLAKWRYNEKDLYFAIKAVNKESVLKHNDTRHVNNEKNILNALSSPFVIRMFGTFQDSENLYFFLEYAAGGELFNRLMRKSSFPVTVAKFYASEIFLALEHVQSLGYVYRDLKPENVMLDVNGHCKLVDFGFSTAPNKSGQCVTNCGTPAYLSPEQLNGKFTNGYTRVVDWWSFGCLIFELMTGLTPFCEKFHDSSYEIYMRVLKGSISFPRYFDKPTKDLIKDLLKSDLSARLVDPAKIRTYEYFNFEKCRWSDVEARKVKPPFVPKIKDEGDSYYFDEAPRDKNPRQPFKKNQAAGCLNYFTGF